VLLVHQLATACHRRREISQQDIDEILLLRYATLEIDDGRAGAEDQLLGLAHVEQRGDAAGLANLSELQRLLPGCQRTLGNLELQIERTQFEVRVGNIADDRGENSALPPLRRQQLSASRFGGPAVPAPEIQSPVDGTARPHGPGGCRRSRIARRTASRAGRRRHRHRRILIRSRDPELRLRLENTSGGNPKVLVLDECRANQRLQLGILKHLPPFRRAERDACRGRLTAPDRVRRRKRWLHVIWSDGAARDEEADDYHTEPSNSPGHDALGFGDGVNAAARARERRVASCSICT
jgi:hypothetical protein